MPISALFVGAPNALDRFPDLRSVPNLRHFGRSAVMDRFRQAIVFDYIAVLGLDVEHYRFGKGQSVDTDLPPAFVDTYEAERLALVDPVLLTALKTRATVVEKDAYAASPPPPRLEYLSELFGVRNRTLVPIRRSDTVYGAVFFTRATPFDGDEVAFLELIAEPIHTAVTRPLLERFAAQQLRLSRGEIACLSHASRGLTSGEIAEATGYQSDTVNTYIKTAVKKLGANNRSQAIAEAIRRRLIS